MGVTDQLLVGLRLRARAWGTWDPATSHSQIFPVTREDPCSPLEGQSWGSWRKRKGRTGQGWDESSCVQLISKKGAKKHTYTQHQPIVRPKRIHSKKINEKLEANIG